MAKASTAKPFYVCPVCETRFTWKPTAGRSGRPPLTCGPICRAERVRCRDRDRYATKLEQQRQRRRRGSPYLPLSCDVEGCDRMAYSRNLCNMHYTRQRQNGSTGQAAPLKRADGEGTWVIVGGYRYLRVKTGVGKSVRLAEHRLVMERMIGRPLLPAENVHHINGERSDNRPENLELWSKSQPAGQRVDDKVAWAIELLALYQPDALASRPVQLRAV